MALEPTLPAERTRMAWQRTTLAGIVSLLVLLRLLAEVSVPTTVVVGVLALLGAAASVAAAIRRSVRGRSLTSETGIGRNAALLTGLVTLACLAAMAYVLLV
jgi:hypothetical protein